MTKSRQAALGLEAVIVVITQTAQSAAFGSDSVYVVVADLVCAAQSEGTPAGRCSSCASCCV